MSAVPIYYMSAVDIFENRWLRRLKSGVLIVYYQSTSQLQLLNGIAKELERYLAHCRASAPARFTTLHALHYTHFTECRG